MPIKRLKKHLDQQYRKWVILTLIILGVVILSSRLLFSLNAGVPASDTVYTLSYDINFTTEKTSARIELSPPWDTPHTSVIAQSIESKGLRLLRSRGKNESSRDIIAISTTPGKKRFLVEFTIHISPLAHKRNILTKKSITSMQRERYLSNTSDIEADHPVVLNRMQHLLSKQKNKESLIKNIYSYINTSILTDKKSLADTSTSALQANKATNLGKVRAMIALCRASKIPARLVTGFIIKEDFDTEEHHWVEVYNETQWLPYDLDNGYSETLPPNFIPVRRGGPAIIQHTNISALKINYDINEKYVPVGKLGHDIKGVMDIFDLTRLSLDARTTLAILLLLPLGAVFTTFCSTVIGIRTFGTFTPSLLALSARYADWITATVIITVVAITGILGRSVMPDKLTRVPRLTIVFTVVAMGMTLSVSLMDYFSYNPAGHVVLLPIIILTSLIDRLYSVLDDSGVKPALVRLGWTAAVGVGCYFILIQEQIGHFILANPEIHLLTIALVLILSTYKYKKLSQFTGFKWITEPGKPKATQNKQDNGNTENTALDHNNK